MEIGDKVEARALDLAQPEEISAKLEGVGRVDRLVLVAIERDYNSVRDYDMAKATRLATVKLVGYAQVIHTRLPDMSENASMVAFGGLAKERPYPGSIKQT